jgi:hypothetical protein
VRIQVRAVGALDLSIVDEHDRHVCRARGGHGVLGGVAVGVGDHVAGLRGPRRDRLKR